MQGLSRKTIDGTATAAPAVTTSKNAVGLRTLIGAAPGAIGRSQLNTATIQKRHYRRARPPEVCDSGRGTMALTPADVHNVAFSRPRIGKRGYNEQEVDLFIDLVEQELTRHITEDARLRKQNATLQRREAERAHTGYA